MDEPPDLSLAAEWVEEVALDALASIATVGALAVAIVWEWAAFRRIRDRGRKPTPQEMFWQNQRALGGPR